MTHYSNGQKPIVAASGAARRYDGVDKPAATAQLEKKRCGPGRPAHRLAPEKGGGSARSDRPRAATAIGEQAHTGSTTGREVAGRLG